MLVNVITQLRERFLKEPRIKGDGLCKAVARPIPFCFLGKTELKKDNFGQSLASSMLNVRGIGDEVNGNRCYYHSPTECECTDQ